MSSRAADLARRSLALPMQAVLNRRPKHQLRVLLRAVWSGEGEGPHEPLIWLDGVSPSRWAFTIAPIEPGRASVLTSR